MAGQANLNKIVNKCGTISTNTTALVGWHYHITSAVTVTLPSTSGLSTGDRVKFTKALNIIPTIQRNTAPTLIQTTIGSDTAVLFDIEAEITFVFNGTDWEV